MRYLALIVLLLISCATAMASHIIGGNFEITQVARNTFDVKLIVFRDCRTQGSNPPVALSDLYVEVFDAATYAPIDTQLLPVPGPQNITLGDACYQPSSLCVEQYEFEYTLTLGDNAAGYIVAAQVCCRNSIVDNIQNPTMTGITWSATIPDPAIQNSTPALGPYPPEGFLCHNILRQLDLSATDADGDSLYYQLVTPRTSPRTFSIVPPKPPPYSPVVWQVGYSANNAIPGSPPLTIDPLTGLLQCKASQIGLYVFAYSISEYRNGVKIGEVQRDLQLQVLPCQVNEVPYFSLPQKEDYTLSAEEELCIAVELIDSNNADSMYVISTYRSSPQVDDINVPGTLKKSGSGNIKGVLCYTPSCEDVARINSMEIDIMGISYNCRETDTVKKNLVIELTTLPANTDGLFPNIFTPNGDGANDYFTITRPETLKCLDQVEIRIFNRWGVMVYHHSKADFAWDGTYNGSDVSDGVYFYTIEGSYAGKPFFYKNFLTLMR